MTATYTRSFVKRADLGGDGSDSQVETNLADMAYSLIADRVPTLMNYSVGFQLIDREPDGNKVFGVAGFRMNGQWMFVPVIFLKGRIKGTEMLYMYDDDCLVPLTEKQINDLHHRQPAKPGQHVPDQPSRLGLGTVDLTPLKRPMYKYSYDESSGLASVKSGGAVLCSAEPHMLGGIVGLVEAARGPKYETDLCGFMKIASAIHRQRLAWLLENSPAYKLAAEKIYGPEFVKEAVGWTDTAIKGAPLSAPAQPMAAPAAGPVGAAPPAGPMDWTAAATGHTSPPIAPTFGQRVRHFGDQHLGFLPDLGLPGGRVGTGLAGAAAIGGGLWALRKLMRRKRPQPQEDVFTKEAATPKVTVVTVKRLSMHGILDDDLTGPEKQKALRNGYVIQDRRSKANIAYRMQTPSTLMNPPATGIYEVVMLDGFEKCWVLTNLVGPGKSDRCVIVRLSDKAWTKADRNEVWVRSLEAEGETEWAKQWGKLPAATGQLEQGQDIIFISNRRIASKPTAIGRSLGGRVWQTGDCGCGNISGRRQSELTPRAESHIDSVRLTGENGLDLNEAAMDQRRQLLVPATAKKLVLGDGPYGNNISLGNPDDVMVGLSKHGIELFVRKTAAGYKFDDVSLEPDEALIGLVTEVGLCEKQACELLEEVDLQGGRYLIVDPLVKKAEHLPTEESDLYAPPFPDQPTSSYQTRRDSVPLQTPMQRETRVDMPKDNPLPFDDDSYPDKAVADMTAGAGQAGIKQLFDAGSLAMIVTAKRDDELIDKHLPILRRATDSWGRILLGMYWHGDRFKDRFGAQDAAKLEDLARSNFESSGEGVLELGEKSSQPFSMVDEDLQI